MTKTHSVKFNPFFLEFLHYLLQLGYGEERIGFIEGVFQRAFFDERVKLPAWQREIKGSFSKIKSELLDMD
ncbi:MAG: hypothetical protein EAX86_05205 [Candidatus Heimdallarchaeota archaeon]|nr:hypothetical protein [Candidatus Heimdallarchaeota archaeon]